MTILDSNQYEVLPLNEQQGEGVEPNEDLKPVKNKKYRNFKYILIVIISTILLIYLYFILSYYIFNKGKEIVVKGKRELNGTKNQTVILISIDGFKPEYLERGMTPNLKSIGDQGVKAKFMIPCFPVLTFPNHFSMVTGLKPEEHGIIANDFYAPDLKSTFNTHLKSSTKDARYWNATPIWTLAEEKGIISMVQMWPGSDININNILPSYLTNFTKLVTPKYKFKDIIQKLKLPLDERPQLILSYLSEVDLLGHTLGTSNILLDQAIKKIDQYIGNLFNDIKLLDFNNDINLIIVSDHGMSNIDINNKVYLDDFIDLDLIQSIHMLPYAGLLFKDIQMVDKVYNELKQYENDNVNFKVFRKHELFSKDNIRIPELILIPSNGYYFAIRNSVNHLNSPSFKNGLHGYFNNFTDMQAIFLAEGPAFKNSPKVIPPFNNTLIFNLINFILGINTSNNEEGFWL